MFLMLKLNKLNLYVIQAKKYKYKYITLSKVASFDKVNTKYVVIEEYYWSFSPPTSVIILVSTSSDNAVWSIAGNL